MAGEYAIVLYYSLLIMDASIWVCGEVLVDLLPTGSVIGGGPANTAKALARLGCAVEFIDGISTDEFGVRARRELIKDGVGLSLSRSSDKPTGKSIISIGAHGVGSYEFDIENSATFDFDASWLPKGAPEILHIGTLATIIEPGASAIFKWAKSLTDKTVIVFDPNVRPPALPDAKKYRSEVEKWVGISTVVKVSEADIAWLYPATSEEDVAREWLDLGAKLVVITRGADGLVGITKSDLIALPGVAVHVIDTVGAGDTVGAVIVEGIAKYGVAGLVGEVLKDVLHRAAKAAAITCTRKGAEPPTNDEIES
jgi:fructokinase